jgi:hypothetical protein
MSLTSPKLAQLLHILLPTEEKMRKTTELSRKIISTWDQRLTSVILATQEAEIRGIIVQSQPRKVAHKTLSQKYTTQERAGGVVQGVRPWVQAPVLQKKKK